ncbi:hypothetical protein F511_17282 [Dorcoceras hygrometricum]|uniref:Chromo domain-containing protein n=1 Tax=Dorcoceras hygrometricum TaxID=472368 RepID=A0A2Z7CJB7_9LAMI|nr:hypothetical protein F511_17282 [Dorcoceras hygrometricum]
MKKVAGMMVPQVLVHWKNKPAEEATWEDAADFQAQFPQTSFGDKAGSEEGDIVRSISGPKPKITNVYTRRPKAQVKGSEEYK